MFAICTIFTVSAGIGIFTAAFGVRLTDRCTYRKRDTFKKFKQHNILLSRFNFFRPMLYIELYRII